MPGPVSLTTISAVVALLIDAHRGGGARGRVRPDVGQQVVDHLAQPDRIAHDLDRVRRGELHRPLRAHRSGGVHRLGGEPDQFGGHDLQREPLVEPGQGQQVSDQTLHARRLGADTGEDPGQIVGMLRRAALEELGIGRDGSDRCAQFVGGVGDELAQVPIRFLQPVLGGHPGREGRLDALQHHVQGAGQPPDLGRLVSPGHPLIEVARGDGVGGAFHVFERPQPEPDQPPAGGHGQDQRAGGHGQFNEEERVQRIGGPADGLGENAQNVLPWRR